MVEGGCGGGRRHGWDENQWRRQGRLGHLMGVGGKGDHQSISGLEGVWHMGGIVGRGGNTDRYRFFCSICKFLVNFQDPD